MTVRNSNSSDHSLLGVGLYSVPQAAKLVSLRKETAVSPRAINYWLWPYGRPGRSASSGLWEPELPRLHGGKYLSFHDLLEVLVVSYFRHQDFSLQKIRRVISAATRLFEHPYPFSHVRFRAWGASKMVAEVRTDDQEVLAFELESGQLLLDFIREQLTSSLDYSEDELLASRWWPLGRESSVVIDPARRFGQPIIHEAAIPTAALFGAYKAEGSVNSVANWFGVSETGVEDAVAYEELLRAA